MKLFEKWSEKLILFWNFFTIKNKTFLICYLLGNFIEFYNFIIFLFPYHFAIKCIDCKSNMSKKYKMALLHQKLLYLFITFNNYIRLLILLYYQLAIAQSRSNSEIPRLSLERFDFSILYFSVIVWEEIFWSFRLQKKGPRLANNCTSISFGCYDLSTV